MHDLNVVNDVFLSDSNTTEIPDNQVVLDATSTKELKKVVKKQVKKKVKEVVKEQKKESDKKIKKLEKKVQKYKKKNKRENNNSKKGRSSENSKHFNISEMGERALNVSIDTALPLFYRSLYEKALRNKNKNKGKHE